MGWATKYPFICQGNYSGQEAFRTAAGQPAPQYDVQIFHTWNQDSFERRHLIDGSDSVYFAVDETQTKDGGRTTLKGG